MSCVLHVVQTRDHDHAVFFSCIKTSFATVVYPTTPLLGGTITSGSHVVDSRLSSDCSPLHIYAIVAMPIFDFGRSHSFEIKFRAFQFARAGDEG